MVDDELLLAAPRSRDDPLGPLRVCSGSLILGAAGLLKGLPARSALVQDERVKFMGARPQPVERIVRSGKIVTAAGVSAGIDLGALARGRNRRTRAREASSSRSNTTRSHPSMPAT